MASELHRDQRFRHRNLKPAASEKVIARRVGTSFPPTASGHSHSLAPVGPGNDLSEEPASGYESVALESETPPLVTLGPPHVEAVHSLCQVGTGPVTKTAANRRRCCQSGWLAVGLRDSGLPLAPNPGRSRVAGGLGSR